MSCLGRLHTQRSLLGVKRSDAARDPAYKSPSDVLVEAPSTGGEGRTDTGWSARSIPHRGLGYNVPGEGHPHLHAVGPICI